MSAIQVKVISVETTTVPTQKGSYDMCEVTYKNLSFQDKVESKKLMSFNHKEVFNTFKKASNGDMLNVQRMKNDKGFWDWVSTGDAPAESATQATGGNTMPSPRSTYETPEERRTRQRLIVRQSSLSNAIDMLKTEKAQPKQEDVLKLAQTFCNWVFEVDSLLKIKAATTEDLKDEDIPY